MESFGAGGNILFTFVIGASSPSNFSAVPVRIPVSLLISDDLLEFKIKIKIKVYFSV
jgi:hypothetical protein